MAQDNFEKERRTYHESCRDVARFVGLPEDSLINQDMKFDRKSLFFPKLRFNPIVVQTEGGNYEQYYEEIVYENVNYEQVLSMPSSWKNVLTWPFHLFKNPLKLASRQAAHFALIDKIYDENPEVAHEVLRKEKPMHYQVLFKYTIRPSKRKGLAIAWNLLNEEDAPEGATRTIEKFVHFRTITPGLRKSFAAESNIDRNSYFAFAGVSVAALTVGLVGLVNNDMEIFNKTVIETSKIVVSNRFWAGAMGTFAAMFLTPHEYYRSSRSLTPKNLSRFTEKERRHLLAFPRDYIPLEQRCEELRAYGFSL